MAIITDDLVRNQMPGVPLQKDGNGKGSSIAGVIDERLNTKEDVLFNQALALARARRGFAYEDGGEFSSEFINVMRRMNMPNRFVHQSLSQDTLNQLLTGGLQRDQQYVANNSEWTGYYLEPLAKFIVPFDTPTRNMLSRIGSPGIDKINWRAITDVFGGSGPSLSNFILPQTQAPQVAQYSWLDKSNLLRQLAWSDVVTFESELFGRMFEPDVRAKIASKLMPSLMLGQEIAYLNGAQQLWPPAPPVNITAATTGGTLAAATYTFVVTAVTGSYSGGVFTQTGESLAWGGSTPVMGSATTTGATGSVALTIMRVPSAIRYNVYVSNNASPSNANLFLADWNANFSAASVHALDDPGGFSAGYFTVTFTSMPTGSASTTQGTVGMHYSVAVTGTGSSATPTNPPIPFTSGSSGVPPNMNLMFDGVQGISYSTYLGTLSSAGVGGGIAAVRTVASSVGALAKADIDNQLEAMYLNARANPECILCGVKDHKALSNIVASNTNFRVVAQSNPDSLSDQVGGLRATKWINQTTGRLMDIIMVPYLMQGTLIFLSLTLPFQVAEITKPPIRIEVNREMWAVEYPPDQSHKTQWAYGAYTSEGMVNEYIGGTGILTGIVTA